MSVLYVWWIDLILLLAVILAGLEWRHERDVYRSRYGGMVEFDSPAGLRALRDARGGRDA